MRGEGPPAVRGVVPTGRCPQTRLANARQLPELPEGQVTQPTQGSLLSSTLEWHFSFLDPRKGPSIQGSHGTNSQPGASSQMGPAARWGRQLRATSAFRRQP